MVFKKKYFLENNDYRLVNQLKISEDFRKTFLQRKIIIQMLIDVQKSKLQLIKKHNIFSFLFLFQNFSKAFR